jgi:hypothetical protein
MIRKELKNLCNLLSESSTIVNPAFSESEWQTIIEEANWHRVLPLLIKKWELTSNSENKSGISEQVIKDLTTYQDNSLRLANIQLFELKIISNILNNAAIDFILLKGLPLSHLIYNSISHRSSKDIDILISDDQLEAVISALYDAGYIVEIPDRSSIIGNKIFKNYYNQIQASHKDRNLCVEIHWRCTTNKNMFTPSVKELLGIAVEKNIHGVLVKTMPLNETIIYLSCHFARTQTLRLKWLCDIDTIIKINNLNWNEIEQLAEKYSCLFALHSTLQLSNNLLNTPLPNNLRKISRFRGLLYLKLSKVIFNTKSEFPALSMLRLLLCGDNLRTCYIDFKSILTPRIHDPKCSINSYRSFYFTYLKRLIRLPVKILYFTINQLNSRLLRLYENTIR